MTIGLSSIALLALTKCINGAHLPFVFWNAGVVRALFLLNNVLVICFTLGMIYGFVRSARQHGPELGTLRIVILIWGLFIIHNNILRLAAQGRR